MSNYREYYQGSHSASIRELQYSLGRTGRISAAFSGLPQTEVPHFVKEALACLNYRRLGKRGLIARRAFPPLRLLERFSAVITEEPTEAGLANTVRFLDRREGRQEALSAVFIPSLSDPSVAVRVDFSSSKLPYNRILATLYTRLFWE
jgi:hypothetical protein